MLKGVQRKFIIVKPDKSSVFETVYFMMREDISPIPKCEKNIVDEANRIINENHTHKKRRGSERLERICRGAPFFLVGALLGTLSVSIAWIISLLR